MTTDAGFAPNPFYRYCTLTACTPNHMNARLKENDYIAGFFTDRKIPNLVFWMKVNEVMGYHEYFNDPRFQRKKPNLKGSWLSRCGDNIYFRDKSGKLIQTATLYHRNNGSIEKDTRHAIVYIGRIFSYSGEKAYIDTNRLPKKLRPILKKGVGIKYTRETDPNFKEYLAWLKSKSLGRHGDPRDKKIHTKCNSGVNKKQC
jgi:hypothetical protein